MSSNSRESKLYSLFGASSSKKGVELALSKKESTSLYFCDLSPDITGDENYQSILHSDGAGTKAIIAYIAYKETGDASYFKGIAQDSLVMNIDDLACVNAFESLVLGNTIGRNRRLIPDEIISALITGYRDTAELLAKQGINISLSGGETADLGDQIRTIVVDSSIFARVKKSEAISFKNVSEGDLIVGLSSYGQCSFENNVNSGIASNGISLARHALIGQSYLKKYPEIFDKESENKLAYSGFDSILGTHPELGTSIADALLSPTRPYSGVLKSIYQEHLKDIHGVVHCTGGGQTKICKFVENFSIEKDNLFACPPIFSLIQKQFTIDWSEMLTVFNLGHRVEIICKTDVAKDIISVSESFNIPAQVIGRIKAKDKHKLNIRYQEKDYYFD